jgi:hypothetical protein
MPSRRSPYNDLQPEANRGAAAAIMRANPFSAILAHCQLTLSRSGARTLAVLQTRFTSHPGASAVSGVHSQTRPSSSVTWRDDIVGVSMELDREAATQEMDCAKRMEVTDHHASRDRNCWPPVSFVTSC